MQLNLNDGGADDETYDTVELTLVLPSSTSTDDTTSALFAALSTCQDLHPDPTEGSDDEYDLDNDDRIVFE